MTSKLEDLDYADNIALVSRPRDHLQHKMNKLVENAKTTGLQIKITKTKV